MKKFIFITLLFVLCASAYAQNPSYEKKLYYTCKVWGYVKYFHSEVSTCKVNWDSVLATTLPEVKSAESYEDFNAALMNMIEAAGPMEPATTPAPEELSPELRFNLNLDWFNDPLLRADVKENLENIKTNFRPHSNCWVNTSDPNRYGWLGFPNDNPMISDTLANNFPNENIRLNILFRYWNIIRYFNPYNEIIDTPCDSILMQFVLGFANAENYQTFYNEIRKLGSKLDDAHVEAVASNPILLPQFAPKIILRLTANDYIVVKSELEGINTGDIIVGIDDKTTKQIEDSLRPLISAGNPDMFRRILRTYLIRGSQNSQTKITVKNYLNEIKSINAQRTAAITDAWLTNYHPCDSLNQVKWKKYPGNIGYVNMGILEASEAKSMFNSLYATKAIIFDVRNYPKGSISEIAKYIYPNYKCFAKLTLPDVTFPGTYYWSESFLGNNNNPVSYKGKVIILCDIQAMSHSEYTCMALRAMPDNIVIGSQTAGADGNVSGFNISNEIRVGLTTLGVYYPDGGATQRIGIVPDLEIYPTIEGIRQGRDEVLDKAFEIANSVVSVDETGIAGFLLNCYPNPASDYIEISTIPSKTSEINIYNILGEIVMSVGTGRDLSARIDISALPKGMYFVKIGGNTAKFLKM